MEDNSNEQSFEPSSVATVANSFVEGFRSYHRSQTFRTGSQAHLLSEESGQSDIEDNAVSEVEAYSDIEQSDTNGETFMTGDFLWDEELGDTAKIPNSKPGNQSPTSVALSRSYMSGPSFRTPPNVTSSIPPLAATAPGLTFATSGSDAAVSPNERSPLISKRVSFGHMAHPERRLYVSRLEPTPFNGRRSSGVKARPSLDKLGNISRRKSFDGKLPTNVKGTSTFGQTLFNSIAILVGIGMLSEPLAFVYAGWLLGIGLLVLYAAVACYTATLLANIMFEDERVQTYSDIGRKAFGSRSSPLISGLFCLELFSLSVVLITLFADSLFSVLPIHSKVTYKVLSLLVIIPTALLPLSLLAYSSVIGIVSSLLIITVLLVDGFSKNTAPGSLWQPAETQLLPPLQIRQTGLAFGLFMAGFSGHAVVPSLARDMRDSADFGRMIRWAFIISTFIYALVGATGYLMFGDAVHEEVSQNLLETKGFNPALNKVLIWMLVVMPISKFALGTRPLNITIESMFGIDSLSVTSPLSATFIARLVVRSLIAMCSVATSIFFPDFSAVMAFLGSFSAFAICIIGPIAAHVTLNGGRWWDAFAFFIAIGMAVWGTAASFW